MADREQIEAIHEGRWQEWRRAHPDSAPDLRCACLTHANLEGLDFSKADLRAAELRDARLNGINFAAADLTGADLREADLRGADLSTVVSGLKAEQLAGADLTGTRLPEPLADLYKKLDAVRGISDSAQKLFVAMLAACLYSWLTIATTTDASLFTNRASTPLPIIQASIPIVGFYAAAPLLLMAVFFYFQLYLQKLWEELGSLPAVFPDGRPLQAKADPWLLSDLVRAHMRKLSAGRPLISYAQTWISILLAWWLVPATLVLFWIRYLPRRDFVLTGFHCAMVAVAVTGAIFWYRLGAATLRGASRKAFNWRVAAGTPGAYGPAAVALVSLVVLMTISAALLGGLGPDAMLPNLRGAELSVKPGAWTGKNDAEYEFVTGIQLNGRDLRGADLTNAFLALALLNDAKLQGAKLFLTNLRYAQVMNAHLEGAYLVGTHFENAQARSAHFANAYLTGAYLAGADLKKADFSGADLTGADLTGADLAYAKFLGARVTAGQLTKAKYADAYVDKIMLADLSLTDNHNQTTLSKETQEDKEAAASPLAKEMARVESLSQSIPGRAPVAELFRGMLITRSVGNPVPPPLSSATATNPAGHSFTATEVAALYNFPPTLDGKGQTIGIIELSGGYRDADLNQYFTQAKLPRPAVFSVGVEGAKNSPNTAGYADGQVEMDIEISGSVAHGADIAVYFAPNTETGYADSINAAAHDTAHRPSVLVIGWGGVEKTWSPQAVQAVNEALRNAALAGMTVVAAAGDAGVTDGLNDGRQHVDFPASSPWALAVGGTELLAKDGRIASEVVWNDGKDGGATGGGVSDLFPPPEWQASLNIPARPGAKPGRALPDVSANGSPRTGYQVFVDGHAIVMGGSSVSAPLWGGLIALLNQGLGRNAGYINPVLYRQLGPGGILHAVTSGDNSFGGVKGYAAGPGWNAAAGWGTPDGGKLLEALRASLPAARSGT